MRSYILLMGFIVLSLFSSAQSLESLLSQGFKDLKLGSSMPASSYELDSVLSPYEDMVVYQRRQTPSSFAKYAKLGHLNIEALEVYAYKDTLQEIRVFFSRSDYNELLAILSDFYGAATRGLDTLIIEEEKSQHLTSSWETKAKLMWCYAIDRENTSATILGFRDKIRYQKMRYDLKIKAQKDLLNKN